MKIYLAGSARNAHVFHQVRNRLVRAGHEVHDWTRGPSAYTWGEVGIGDTDAASVKQMRAAATDALLLHGMLADMDAIDECEVFVLLLPCGADAHYEAGLFYATRGERPLYILAPSGFLRASQFYATADKILDDVDVLLEVLT